MADVDPVYDIIEQVYDLRDDSRNRELCQKPGGCFRRPYRSLLRCFRAFLRKRSVFSFLLVFLSSFSVFPSQFPKLISAEEISCIDLIFHIIQAGIVAVRDDALAAALEFLQISDDLAAEERRAAFQCRFVDNNGSAFRFDAFHDALDAALAGSCRSCSSW